VHRLRAQSVLENSPVIAADGGNRVILVRTWTLENGAHSIVLAKSKLYGAEQVTPDKHRDEHFARAVAERLGWTVGPGLPASARQSVKSSTETPAPNRVS
jgi:hypothetical protein